MDFVITFLNNAAYIFAIALQLAAALLLVGNTNVKPEKIIKAYFDSRKAIAIQEDGSLLDRSGLEETANAAWTNKIAFCYLFAGYLIGVLGECTMHKWKALVIIALLTAALFAVPYKYAKTRAKNFRSISEDDIPHEKGITVMRKTPPKNIK